MRVRAATASAPLLTGALAFAAIAWTLLQRSAGLQLPAYDTAFFEQVVWNLGHGRGFTSGFFGASFLGLHFSPLLVLPAAVELAWPDARALALLQAAALGLSAPAAFLLLRALLEGRPGAPVASARSSCRAPVFWKDPRHGTNNSEELPVPSPPTSRTRKSTGPPSSIISSRHSKH